MKSKLNLLVLLLITTMGYSQIEINGVVKDDKTKTPLEEVRIQLRPISNKGAGYWTGTMTKESGRYKVSTSMGLPAVMSYKKQGCGEKSIKIKNGDEVPNEVFLDCTDEAIKAIIIEQTLDTDGDGLVDKNDKCPKEYGTKENEGCPDEGVSNEKVIEEKDKLEPEDNVKNEEYSKSEIEKKINSSIYFELDQYSINPAEKNKLNNIKNLLDSNSNLNINIVGHASSDGPSDYNMSLSERRANTVKMTLINLGIDSNRLNVSFSGEDKPASSNSSKEGKSKNRRVEISVQ